MALSRRIPFDRLPNLRDLGGIVTKSGRKIASGYLYRSGALNSVSKEDYQGLSELQLKRIYDFRTPSEREEKPDVVLPGVAYVNLPILSDSTMGISRENRTDKAALRRMKKEFLENPHAVSELMQRNYLVFAMEETPREGYETFLHDILSSAKEEKGAYLWHCTAGKDRAGFATVLLLEILGVDRETIFQDYLETNRYMTGETKMVYDKIPLFLRVFLTPKARKRLAVLAEELTQVRREYLELTYRKLEELYGSFSCYLREGLHITEEEEKLFQELFLEAEEENA